MDIAFIADPLDSFKVYKDSTFAMMTEAARRGHALYAMQPEDLWRAADGRVMARALPIEMTGQTPWYRAGKAALLPLASFGGVVMRKDPPFDMEYVYTTYLLELAETQGARVFNAARAIRDHNEKLAITGFPQFIAPTLITRDGQALREFAREHGDIILKPLDGMGGMGVFRVGPDELNLGSIIEMLGHNGRATVMAQRYIPEIVEGDKRVLVIDGIPVPYALARVPQGKEIRGNLAAGGVGHARPLSARDREIAEALGPELARRGLLLVGLDIIGDYLTEINVTSPTCFVEITTQTGFPVAGRFIDALEARLGAHSHG